MGELTFESRLSWMGGGESRGRIEAGGEALSFSVPTSMGGVGVGTNPEELLVSAVGACYTATLASLLAGGRLPATALEVRATATVADYPGPSARVSAVTVHPTFVGPQSGREAEYEQAARKARERCFIGRHLASTVEYAVGDIGFADAEAGFEAVDVLDVRALPPPRRHELIFTRLEELGEGAVITLVNDHDPKPLHYQLQATQPGRFSWEYLEQGPEAWRVRIGRLA